MHVTEAQALDHSIEWIDDAVRAVTIDRLSTLRLSASLTFSAVQAAYHGEDAFDSFEQRLALLADPFEENEASPEADDDLRLAELDMLTGTVPIYVEAGHGQEA